MIIALTRLFVFFFLKAAKGEWYIWQLIFVFTTQLRDRPLSV